MQRVYRFYFNLLLFLLCQVAEFLVYFVRFADDLSLYSVRTFLLLILSECFVGLLGLARKHLLPCVGLDVLVLYQFYVILNENERETSCGYCEQNLLVQTVAFIRL